VYPLLVATWALLGLPVQAMRMLLSVAAGVVDGIIDMLQLILASAMPSFSTFQGAKAVTPGPSMWRALWNDIFSKVSRLWIHLEIRFTFSIFHFMVRLRTNVKLESLDAFPVFFLIQPLLVDLWALDSAAMKNA
jgi:hypothetical protein